jgi:phage shock protein PspC (stress-responsive transcriptional regulator)
MVERRSAPEWTRARDGAWLGGVARGLATHFGLPVVAMRLAFVIGTLCIFWGLVVYVALWVLMPLEPLLLPPSTVAASAGSPPPPPPGTA